jgi:probable HAF family extracellular repeat protein
VAWLFLFQHDHDGVTMKRILTLVAVAVLCITSFFTDQAQAYYFQGFGSDSLAWAVSANGSTVVGNIGVGAAQQAFRWTQSGGMVGMGYLPGQTRSSAWGVSADGSVVVGNSGTQAFRWTQSGGMAGLAGSPYSNEANGVSADGRVVVGWSGGTYDNQATRWTQNGIERLGYLGGYTDWSYAYGASADGSVVVGDSYGHAFRWTQSSGMVGLGNLPGQTYSYARDVSANGSIVVGYSGLPSEYQAFLWTLSGGMVGLGYLPGQITSYGYGVSPDGSIVVGESGGKAFIWDSVNGMQDLKNLLMILYGLNLDGWSLSEAYDISADGKTIVGYGINPLGQKEGWVANLTPVPLPSAIWLFGSGLAGIIGFIKLKGNRRG